ncbi:MAG: TM2 domain-containing protein [Coriobacteriia bacterium]|nr:TM2 domain-containing protein [Coriobacteriia bacterium]
MANGNSGPTPQPSYEVPPNQGGYQQPPQQQPPQQQPPQPNYGFAPQVMPSRQSWGSARKDKWVAFVLAWFLGTFGIHKFYLGYRQEGMIMLLVSLIGGVCFGLGTVAMAVIATIEAVRYVMLSQEDFESTYVYGTKPWL